MESGCVVREVRGCDNQPQLASPSAVTCDGTLTQRTLFVGESSSSGIPAQSCGLATGPLEPFYPCTFQRHIAGWAPMMT